MNNTEFILNLAWMLLCIGALSAQVWRDRVWRDGLRSAARGRSTRSRGTRLRHSLSVLVAALALFPVISASDDRIRLADFEAVPAQQAAFDRGQTHGLASSANIEDPEHGQTVDPFFLIVILCFFLIVPMSTSVRSRWSSVTTFGRAPPRFA